MVLLAMNTSKHKSDVSTIPESLHHYTAIHTVEVDNQVKATDAIVNLFSDESYHISRFISREFERTLIELLKSQKFDIIQLETLYLAPYLSVIREHSDAMISMRAHNVEHEIWERITSKSGFLPKKWYLKYLTTKLKKFEMGALNEYDFLVAISDRDLNKFKQLGYQNGAIASPVGIDLNQYKLSSAYHNQKVSLFFIGSLDWMPNWDGLNWFLEEVWPEASQISNELEFHIAGRNTPHALNQKANGQLHVHGEVSDAHMFIDSHQIMIVPLFSGSGMRVKILEGMALGKTIITTSLGLEGIHARDGHEVIIADDAQAFIQAIKQCLTHPDHLIRIGQNARKFVKEQFDSIEIAEKLLDAYKYITSDKYMHH